MKLNRILIFIFFGMFFPSSILAANKAIMWGYSPFSADLYSDTNGQPKGRYADIVINTLNHANLKFETTLEPNRRARKTIADGDVNFFISVHTSVESPENFYTNQVPIDKLRLRAYWIGDRPAVTLTTDLIGQSVILIASFQYAGYRHFIEDPNNNVTLAVNVGDHRRALAALSLGRASYMLGYERPISSLQQEMQVANLHSSLIVESNLHMYLSKSVNNSRHIMDQIDKAYAELYGKAQ